MEPGCIKCFTRITSDAISCRKCRGNYHLMCVKKCVDKWSLDGKRRSTWMCDLCVPDRNCGHSVPKKVSPTTSPRTCDCDLGSKLEIIKILTNDLEKAHEEIACLKNKLAQLELGNTKVQDAVKDGADNSQYSWQTARAHRKQKRSYSEVLSCIPTSNRFQRLHVDEANATAKENHETATLEKTRRKRRGKKKVLVVTDSHGRDCGSKIQAELGDDFDSVLVCHPGAPFRIVAESAAAKAAGFGEEDHVVILAGTNDLSSPHTCPHLDLSIVNKLSVSTNVHLSHVPYRFDYTSFNKIVDRLNRNIDNHVVDKPFISNITLDSLTYRDFTKHGLHLNKKGKTKLSRLIASNVLDMSLNCLDQTNNLSPPPIIHPHSQTFPSQSKNSQSSRNFLEVQPLISSTRT